MKNLNAHIVFLLLLASCAGGPPTDSVMRNPSAETVAARPQDFKDYYPNYFLNNSHWRTVFPGEIPLPVIEQGFQSYEEALYSVLQRLTIKGSGGTEKVKPFAELEASLNAKEILIGGDILSAATNYIYDELTSGKTLENIIADTRDIGMSDFRKSVAGIHIGIRGSDVGIADAKDRAVDLFKKGKGKDAILASIDLRDIDLDANEATKNGGKADFFYFNMSEKHFDVKDERVLKKLKNFVAETAMLSFILKLDTKKTQKEVSIWGIGKKESAPMREFIPVSWYENNESLYDFVARIEERRSNYIPSYAYFIQRHYEFMAQSIPFYKRVSVAEMISTSFDSQYPGTLSYFAGAYLKSLREDTPWFLENKKVRSLCLTLLEGTNVDAAVVEVVRILNRDLTEDVVQKYVSRIIETRFPNGYFSKMEVFSAIRTYYETSDKDAKVRLIEYVTKNGDGRMKAHILSMVTSKDADLMQHQAVKGLVRSLVTNAHYRDNGELVAKAAKSINIAEYFDDVMKKHAADFSADPVAIDYIQSFHMMPKDFQAKVIQSYIDGDKKYPQSAFRFILGNVLKNNPDMISSLAIPKMARVLLDTTAPLDMNFYLKILGRGHGLEVMNMLYEVRGRVGSLHYANNTTRLYHETLKQVFTGLSQVDRNKFLSGFKDTQQIENSEAFSTIMKVMAASGDDACLEAMNRFLKR